jgi:hypothetical protein
MRKIKEILRLKLNGGLSHRQIVAALGVSLGAVSKAVSLAESEGMTWSLIADLDETDLETRLRPRAAPAKRKRAPPDGGLIHFCPSDSIIYDFSIILVKSDRLLGVNHLDRLRDDPLVGEMNAVLLGLLPEGLGRVGEIAAKDGRLSAAYIEANPGTEWFSFDTSDLTDPMQPIPLGHWDAWVLDGVLDAIPDPVAALEKLRVALPHGFLLISFQNAQHWRCQARLAVGDSDLPLRPRYCRQEMYVLLERAGFRVEAVYPVFSTHPMQNGI